MHEMTRDQGIAILLGLAIGDALGAPMEGESSPSDPKNHITSYVGGGVHNIPKGYFTDDTSMSLISGESLIKNNGNVNPFNLMRNWLRWYREGYMSSTGKCFDIGMTCESALHRFEIDPKGIDSWGETGKYAAGNGALMRLAPFVMCAKTVEEAVEKSMQQTVLTHNCEEAVFYSKLLAHELFTDEAHPDHPETKHLPNVDRTKIMSGGYVKETYQCAWWAVCSSTNFEDAVLLAVNRGHDADTCAAVTGMLAGRKYGIGDDRGIPDWMIGGLHQSEMIIKMAHDLVDLRNAL